MPSSIKDLSTIVKAPISTTSVVEGVDELKENNVKEADGWSDNEKSVDQEQDWPVSSIKQEDYGQNESTENEWWEKQVNTWLAEELTLTESQKKLNSELLRSLRRLGFDLMVHKYDYNVAPVLEKFLEKHKDNKDLKVVLNLQRGELKTTILHKVAQFNIHAAESLLGAGADPNVQDNKQKTPLHYVAEGSHISVVRLFLKEEGVDINAVDNQGKTPFHYAAHKGYENVAKEFLEKGADVTTQDKNGYTALHHAIMGRVSDPKILEMLVSYHARSGEEAYWEKAERSDWGDSLSKDEEDIFNMRKEKTKELLTNTVDKKGNTLLHFAAQHRRKEIIEFLAENGVDVNAKNGKGITPVQVAAKYENEDFIDFLIESKNTQCIKSETKGWTPLNIAIKAACNKRSELEKNYSEEENLKLESLGWEKTCLEKELDRELEGSYRVIEKLVPFSDIEAFRPKGIINKIVKKVWYSGEHSLVKAANEDKKIQSILDNAFKDEKLQKTSVVLPRSGSFYNKVGLNTELKKLERSITTKDIGITRRNLEKLREFSDKVKEAKNVIELSQIVDKALLSGIRLKFYRDNFIDHVTAKIEQLNGVAQDPKIVRT